jgi:uncharacterized protein YlxP (DUF503 family)
MIIGFLSLEIYIPYSHSLKEKRKTLSGLKDRLKNRYNVAFAELEYHKKWQRTKIGMVTLNNQKMLIDNLFNKIIADAEENIDGHIIEHQIHYF